MLKKFIRWVFADRSINNVLDPKKPVRINGIKFTIRKLNTLDYMTGAQTLLQIQNIYEKGDKTQIPALTQGQIDKIKTHYRDVLMAAVVNVRCKGVELTPVRKESDEGPGTILVDKLMTDWALIEELYTEIIQHTYGKKKFKQLKSLKQNYSS